MFSLRIKNAPAEADTWYASFGPIFRPDIKSGRRPLSSPWYCTHDVAGREDLITAIWRDNDLIAGGAHFGPVENTAYIYDCAADSLTVDPQPFHVEDLLPVLPLEGPPLPRFLGILWPFRI